MSNTARLGAALTVLCLGALVGCSRPPASKPVQKQSPLVLQNIVLTETSRKNNTPVWELKASRAEYSQDQSVATIQKVEGIFYQNGRKALTIRAPRGEVRIAARQILLLGGVRALSPVRATTLDSPQVLWSPDRNLLEAQGPVEVRQPKDRIRVRARNLTGDLAAQVYTLTGDVQGDSPVHKLELRTPKLLWSLSPNRLMAESATARDLERQVVLTAPEMSWEVQNNRVIARGAGRGRADARQAANTAWLVADQLIWELPRRILQGNGQVEAEIGRPARRFEAEWVAYSLVDNTLKATTGRYFSPFEKLSVEGQFIDADLKNNTVRTSGGRSLTRLQTSAKGS